jgi:hypothetical protein
MQENQIEEKSRYDDWLILVTEQSKIFMINGRSL